MSHTARVGDVGWFVPAGAKEPVPMSRRKLLTGLGLVGVGATGAAAATKVADRLVDGGAPTASQPPVRATFAVRGEALRFEVVGTAPGVLPAVDRPFSVRGELIGDTGAVGRFQVTPVPGFGTGLQLHTFEMAEGTLLGMGSAVVGDGAFAVVGGTGRYSGASGSYTAHFSGGTVPTAEFLFDLTMGA